MTTADRDKRVADLIAERRKVAQKGLQPSQETDAAPLSTVQLALWTMGAIESVPGSTNRPCVLRIRGPLAIDSLEVAIRELVRRHEPLRTAYPLSGDEPTQVVHDEIDVVLAVEDVSHLGAHEQSEAITRAMADAKRTDLDPAHKVPFGLSLLVEGPESHILIFALSHIAFDGWSEAVIQADLLELYRAAVDGDSAVLPALGIRFSDYARWERDEAAQRDSDSDMAYWHQALAGLGHAPAIPPHPDSGTGYEPVSTQLSAAELASVRKLARAEDTTPFVVLLAGVELAARELMGAEDFATMCPVAGRDRPEVHDLIGCFINPVLVRSSFRHAQTRLEHLRAVRSRVADALAHRHVPNQSVLQQFGGWSRRPVLHRISFQWRDFPRRPPSSPVAIDLESIMVPDTVRGLALYVTPTSDGADLEILYNPDLFGRDSVLAWSKRLRAHVEDLCEDPYGAIGPLEPARSQPDPTASLIAEPIETVPASIARHVRLAPDAMAIRTPVDTLSYRELWDRSGALASTLVDRGVQPGTRVGILTNRNAGHAVSMLAVLRAGAVVVPLDAGLPANRLSLMAETAQMTHLIVVEACGELADVTADCIAVDHAGQIEGPSPEAMLRPAVEPADDHAYVFFTSGTSATPKAVLGTHVGLSHFLAWERARIGITPDDRVGGVTGPSFDVSLREIFLPLTSGATLTLAPETIWPDRGLRWVHDAEITVLHITPSLAGAWMADADGSTWTTSLRWTLFAGEQLDSSVVRSWRASIGADTRVMNLYGPTECCMVKSAHEVGPSPRPGVQSVGHALPHSQLIVMDPDAGGHCQPGEKGEVVIRTAVGTAGYLGDANGGFGKSPFGSDSDEIVYRTGDIGWYEPDWAVTVQGRIDDQVKIDGIRVEPTETAGFLRQHPGVLDCAVLPVQGDNESLLAAFVVPAGQPPTDAELRRHLHNWLRAAAVPPTFTIVDHIPLTANNKIDRPALLARIDEPPPSNALVEPDSARKTTEIGDLIAEVWGDVLNVELRNDVDFFSAGGTSLRALRILARLQAATGASAPIDLFFDSPTLVDFTAAFETLAAEGELGQQPVPAVLLGTYDFDFPAEHADALRRVATELQVRPFVINAVLWSAYLSRKTESDSIAVGVIDAGVDAAAAASSAGMLSALAAGTQASDLNALVQQTTAEVEEILSAAEGKADASVLVSLRAEPLSGHDGPALELRFTLLDHGGSDDGGKVTGRLLYDVDKTSATEARNFCSELVEYVSRAVSDPSRALPDVLPLALQSDDIRQLSFAQERMWTIEQMEPGTTQYVVRFAFEVNGALNIDALDRAFSTVIARHDVLRSRFSKLAGAPQLVIDPPWDFRLATHDLGDGPAEAKDQQLHDLIEEMSGPFDLAAGRLARAAAVSDGDDRAVLIIAVPPSGLGWRVSAAVAR